MEDYAQFAVLRGVSNVELGAGVLIGNVLAEAADLNRWIVATGVWAVVTAMEYPQSRWAARDEPALPKIDVVKTSWNKTRAVSKEIIAGLWASWHGTGANVEINGAAGLQTTRARSLFQAASYGTGVGLYTSPLPGYTHAREGVIWVVKKNIANPAETIPKTAAASFALFGAIRGVRYLKERRAKNSQDTTQI